jgi:hypothetical protein
MAERATWGSRGRVRVLSIVACPSGVSGDVVASASGTSGQSQVVGGREFSSGRRLGVAKWQAVGCGRGWSAPERREDHGYRGSTQLAGRGGLSN